jgi:hypothetical protein
MGGQRMVKSIVCGVTCEGHDDVQKLSVAMEELDKVKVYVTSDVIVLKGKWFACRLLLHDFRVV